MIERRGTESPPRVSVVMGVFNGLPHLERAIRSIAAQTFSDWEFVIIDDASTDGSAEVIERYAGQDKRIVFHRNMRNAGLGAVLRAGVAMARGELIARMDADDISVPQRLAHQVEFFDKHPATDVLGSHALDVTEDEVPVRERKVPATHERIVSLIWSCPIIHPTVMFRREAILAAGSYSADLRRRQDYDLWFRCVRAGLKFANIQQPLVHYLYSDETLRRNNLRSAWQQVKMGIKGCRLVNAPAVAYVATTLPLVEAMVPRFLRMKLVSLKSRIDPRAS